MAPGHIPENKRLTARQRWLMEHKEIRFYFKKDDYELLESLASEEGLTVKDYILKIARDLEQLKAEIPTLEKLGVNCKPARVLECINGLREKLVVETLKYTICKRRLEICMERLEELKKSS